jgi:hypothetical protein
MVMADIKATGASQERMKAKMEATIKAGQEYIKAGKEVMKATELEAIAEHYEWASRIKAMHMLTAPQDQAFNVLPRDPRGSMYEETIVATEDRFGEQQLAVGYRCQQKTGTQDDGEFLQGFATAIEQLTHCAFPALHEHRIRSGPGKVFGNGIRD